MNALRRQMRTGWKYWAITALLASRSLQAAETIGIHAGSENPQTLFALEELTAGLARRGYTVQRSGLQEADIVLFPVGSAAALENMVASVGEYGFHLKPEGFSIRRSPAGKIWVAGADAAGVMYGGLELAEQIRVYGMKGIEKTDQNPYMEKRGMKFNLPLDVRTPSYSDMSEAGQRAIADVWDFGFWKEMIDGLARDRYNMISLWSLHPFPSMIKVPEYPDIALADVKRSTAPLAETFSGRATGYDAPDILRNAETVLTLSMDEKIVFWKKVMAYAKERNIDVYMVTWNVYTYGTEGKYGITDELANTTTKDYYRKSVRQLFLTYPDLAGIGVTTGENMGKGNEAFEAKEDWVFQTYGQGVLDVVREQPGRRITFIHRQHESAAGYIVKTFAPLAANKNIEFLYSFKYAKAHVFSSTKQSFHEEFVRDIKGTETLWTLRNDDNYYFRWGAPGFVREFIRNMPREVSRGFYYGSDGHVWGREFLSKEPETPRRPAMERHWYHWMLWGRLGYDPRISNERLVGILRTRFPGVDVARLFVAWQEASMIYPVTTGFHWGALDYQWYIEGCKSRPEPAQTPSGFHDVNRFITLPPHRETGYQSIPDYVKMTVAGKRSGLKSPLAVSRELHDHADYALREVKTLDAGSDRELSHTLQDIQTMAYLGKYYAHKISGATHLAAYRETKEIEAQREAVIQLTSALEYWKLYTSSAMQRYKNPLWTNRVGHVDWMKLTEDVEHDIEIADSPLVGEANDTSSSIVWTLDNLLSIGGRPLTVAGNPVVKETDIGKAMEFDGIDDGLIVHGCPLNGCPSFTMEILFKPYASFPNNIEQRFLHMQNPALGSRRALLELRLTGKNAWYVDTHIRADSAFLTLLATHLPHPVGPWYHIALVYENGVGKHYVNGVEEMSGRVPYIPVENADVSIGMRMNRVSYFKGAIRAVSMTRHALRPNEFSLLAPGTSIVREDSTEHLLFADDFSSGWSNWIAEFENPSGSSLSVRNGTLDISASAGATVWLKKKLPGNVMISYDVTVVDSGGKNDRVSDMNAFWMASEPSRADTFKRDGKFSSYDDLNLYYAGVGGHDNTTTRFRRYHAGGEKPVLQEYTDKGHLLEGNRVYAVAITVRNSRTTFSVNGVRYFEYADKNPLTEGYFGFRTTRSRQRVSNFKVHYLESSPPR